MKIGIVSDTHSFDLPQQLIEDFKNVDLIIHAGDFCSYDDLKVFKEMAETIAVYGNMDEAKVCRELLQRKVFDLEGVSIGLCHGHGDPDQVFEIVKREFSKDKVDMVIFGHSHYALNKKIGNVLYFNPGSPNDIVRAPYCSYGFVEINGQNIDAQIIKVK